MSLTLIFLLWSRIGRRKLKVFKRQGIVSWKNIPFPKEGPHILTSSLGISDGKVPNGVSKLRNLVGCLITNISPDFWSSPDRPKNTLPISDRKLAKLTWREKHLVFYTDIKVRSKIWFNIRNWRSKIPVFWLLVRLLQLSQFLNFENLGSKIWLSNLQLEKYGIFMVYLVSKKHFVLNLSFSVDWWIPKSLKKAEPESGIILIS